MPKYMITETINEYLDCAETFEDFFNLAEQNIAEEIAEEKWCNGIGGQDICADDIMVNEIKEKAERYWNEHKDKNLPF